MARGRRRHRYLMAVGGLALVGALAPAAGATDSSDAAGRPAGPSPETMDDPLSLLGPGGHLGTTSFAPVTDAVTDVVTARTAEAAEAGMGVGRVHLSWDELEPIAGSMDLGPLDAQLATLARDGLRPMVTLGFADVNRYSVPADLVDPADPSRLAPGVRLDDPEVVERYATLYDAIEGRLRDHGAWLLSMANEPNTLLEDKPDDDRETEAQAMEGLAAAVRNHVRRAWPELPVTISLSPVRIGEQAYLDHLVGPGDVATFNLSCIDWTTFETFPVERLDDQLRVMATIADGRPMVFQELSCGSGFTDRPSLIRSSPEYQRDFFEAFWDRMGRDPSIRAAFALDTLDWPLGLANTFTDPLRAEGLEGIADRYDELMATWGLLREDGSAKPSWDVFLRRLGAWSGDTDHGRATVPSA